MHWGGSVLKGMGLFRVISRYRDWMARDCLALRVILYIIIFHGMIACIV